MATITVKKALIGKEDISYGNGTFSRATSTGGTQNITKLPSGVEVYNVKDYGAVGDGTTDDTTAIQAAIDAAEVSGGTVYFPVGTYSITDTLSINKPVWLVGAAAGFEQIYSTADFLVRGSVIQLATSSFTSATKAIVDFNYQGSLGESRLNAGISNMVIHGNRSTEQNPTHANARTNNTYGIGISVTGARYVTVRDCYVLRCAEDGFKSVTGGTQSTPANNIVITDSAFLGNYDDGIEFAGGDSFISNVQCGYNGGDGIAAGSVTITGARCWDNFTMGLRITTSDCQVANSTFYDNNSNGILVSGTQERVTVSGTVCQDNGQDFALTDPERAGVRVSGVTTNSTISGLVSCNKDDAGGAGNAGQRYGLYLDSASHAVQYAAISGDDNPLGLLSDAAASAYTPTNVSTDRAYDADTVAVAELADIVGTLIADLQAKDIIT